MLRYATLSMKGLQQLKVCVQICTNIRLMEHMELFIHIYNLIVLCPLNVYAFNLQVDTAKSKIQRWIEVQHQEYCLFLDCYTYKPNIYIGRNMELWIKWLMLSGFKIFIFLILFRNILKSRIFTLNSRNLWLRSVLHLTG